MVATELFLLLSFFKGYPFYAQEDKENFGMTFKLNTRKDILKLLNLHKKGELLVKNFDFLGKKTKRLPALLFLLLLTPLILGGCLSDQDVPGLKIEGAPELVQAVEDNRTIEPLPRNEMEEKLTELLYPYQDFEEVDPEKIGTVHKDLYRISQNEMLDDIDFLFRVLKYGYAGYSLFGGDDRFGQSKGEMIKNVEQNARIDNGQPSLVLGEFLDLVRDKLSFIQDGHFAVGGERFHNHHQMHLSHDLEFFKNEEGYYIREGTEKLFIERVNNSKPEEYLKLSLSDSGKLVFKLVVLSPEEKPYPVTLEFKGNKSRELILNPAQTSEFLEVPFEHYEKEGIPVIVNRRLSHRNEEQLNDFIASAKDLENKEVSILDLRGNPGGSDFFASEWIKSYTSREPGYAQGYIDLTTRTTQALQPGQQRFKPTPKGWSEINYSTPKTISNDRYLLVLIDNRIGSSGESFVRMLKQVENVVLIGSNTAGVKTVGNVTSFSLPNSGIDIQLGTTLFLELDLDLIEGRGYKPDIWVEPQNALDLALKFIDNYLR